MSKLISFVPEKQRPYVWALNEMEKMFPEPDRFNIVGLDTDADFDQVGAHTSFFAQNNDAERGILRVYWPSDERVKYSIIENLAQIREEHPELVRHYLRNGIAAYEHRKKIDSDKGKFFVRK